jgi:hypothetical protein
MVDGQGPFFLDAGSPPVRYSELLAKLEREANFIRQLR